MWKFTWKFTSHTLILYTVLLHLYSLQISVQGNVRHYLLEKSKDPSNSDPESNEYPEKYHECYITVQEIKRIAGQCVKIRDNIQGCVAGNLMDPFHKDCL